MHCNTCDGIGYVITTVTVNCPTCSGKGSYWRAAAGGPEWEPCSQCGGKRYFTKQERVICQICGGTGKQHDSSPASMPLTQLQPDPALLQLEGSWKGAGWRYEFIKQNYGYDVTQYNLLGWNMGDGVAEVSGSVLTMTVKNKLTGSMTVDFQLSGDQLSGTIRGLISLPLILKRS